MKKLLIFCFIFLMQFCFSQSKIISKIDSLNSETEVQNFVRNFSKQKDSIINKKFELKHLQDFDRGEDSDAELRKIADSLNHHQSYFKTDFNNDGYTDLLVIGDNHTCITSKKGDRNKEISCDFSVFAILNFGDIYEVKELTISHFNEEIIPQIITENNINILKIYLPEYKYKNFKIIGNSLTEKKLTYKFGDFIEYNPNPSTALIEKISFSTGMCFGTCPMFKIEILENGEAKFYAQKYNFSDKYSKKDEGTFVGKIKSEDLTNIKGTLNYIDFKNLQDNYFVNWTDDQTSKLEVTFDDGKTKTIQDYGLIGTYGLKRLYQILFDLRFNQNWKKVK